MRNYLTPNYRIIPSTPEFHSPPTSSNLQATTTTTMDLVAGVRKEGSRGGRDSFKWSDVQQSQHRENYLGHSLMAPVGRWQNGRDLQWYAKAEDKDAEKARTEREEELRRVKEAEEEAMARALGLPVPPRSTNANLTPLGSKDVQKAIQETAGGDAEDGGKGIGFGSYGGRASVEETGVIAAAVLRGGATEVVTETERGNEDITDIIIVMIVNTIVMNDDTG
ncbi:hypothetical protein DTO166G4_1503 [Paecilomyces variotii]|nr:hypothetical protein DTO166G4_1503 [Paecilomyces variotii]KAJ9226137.1 hypothetical protein DTO169C6_1350 [Paecilomyces variotii]KAJ9242617.1 hypothetical protein DTO166G5_372 [Paecilomyces variotii]KAJ9266583.1 hypothetical protein DTO195F2_1106 [Paecilomyces variotii]KAJ9329181.1 hypothetical protein DTO027B3_581 [Paecilomyces variotii]